MRGLELGVTNFHGLGDADGLRGTGYFAERKAGLSVDGRY